MSAIAIKPQTSLYQCRHCFTVYDENLGDPEQQIVAGTGFQQLSATYYCPLCEAGKEDFVTMDLLA